MVVGGFAAVTWWAVGQVVAAIRETGARDRRDCTAEIMALFAPGIAAAAADPRALLTWQPLAATARHLFPQELALLDAGWGGPFPFSADQIEAAHARWTTDWLAWERAHAATYKLKAAVAEDELQASGGSATGRARLQEIDREKLDLYQRRYEEYVRIAKALQALHSGRS